MSGADKQSISLDDLAGMVAQGFESVTKEIGTVSDRLTAVEHRLDGVEHRLEALNSNVNNYPELSEKRYVELKQRDVLLAKWLKLVAEKTGVPIDVSQLEKI